MTSKKKLISQDDFVNTRFEHPHHQEKREDITVRLIRIKKASSELIDELRKAGFDIDLVQDLYTKRINYKKAVPILAKWLPQISDFDCKETIVRALSVKTPESDIVAKILIREYINTDNSRKLYKWAIGNSLNSIANDAVLDDIIQIATDKRHGSAREMVVLSLKNMKGERAIDTLISLVGDIEVTGHALLALGHLKASKARCLIEKYTTHPNTFWRNEAKKAIKKIDKASDL